MFTNLAGATGTSDLGIGLILIKHPNHNNTMFDIITCSILLLTQFWLWFNFKIGNKSLDVIGFKTPGTLIFEWNAHVYDSMKSPFGSI